MPKRVPADSLLDAGSSRRRLNDFQQQDVWPAGEPPLGVRAGDIQSSSCFRLMVLLDVTTGLRRSELFASSTVVLDWA